MLLCLLVASLDNPSDQRSAIVRLSINFAAISSALAAGYGAPGASASPDTTTALPVATSCLCGIILAAVVDAWLDLLDHFLIKILGDFILIGVPIVFYALVDPDE